MNKGHIYKLTSPSEKLYIGQAVCISSNKEYGFKGRWKSHIIESRNKSFSRCLDNAIRKYGSDSFKVELIEEIDIDKLNEREKYWISELNTISPNGYNLTTGGGQGYRQHEETKDKISKTRIEKKIGKGKVYPKQHRIREEDINLPKYVVSYHDKNGRCGYMITNHPTIKNKKFSSSKLTMEEKLELILKYIENPEPRLVERKIRIRNALPVKKLPKYLVNYNYDSRIGYRISGHPTLKDKVFASSKFTLDEKLKLALEYLNTNI